MQSTANTASPKAPSTVGTTNVHTANTAANAKNRTLPQENNQDKNVNGNLLTNQTTASEAVQANSPSMAKNELKQVNEQPNATSFPLGPFKQEQQEKEKGQQQQQFNLTQSNIKEMVQTESSQANAPTQKNLTETPNNQFVSANASNVSGIPNCINTAPFSMNMPNTGYNGQYATYNNLPNKAAYARKIKITDYTDTTNANPEQKPVLPNVQSACKPVIHAENREEINKGLEQKDRSMYRWYAVPERMMSNIDQTCFADDVYDIQPRSMYRPVPSMTNIRPSMYGIPLPSSLYRMRLNSMGNVISSSGSNNNIIGGFGNSYYPSMNNMGSLYQLSSMRSQPPSLLGSFYSFSGWPANYSMYNMNGSMYNQPNNAGVNSMYQPNMSMYAQNSFYANDNVNSYRENEERNANFGYMQPEGNANINNNNSINSNNNISSNAKTNDEVTAAAVAAAIAIVGASTINQDNNQNYNAMMNANTQVNANRTDQTNMMPFEGQPFLTSNMPITAMANTADQRKPELNNTSNQVQMPNMTERKIKHGVSNSAIPMVVVVCNSNGGDRRSDKYSASSNNSAMATTVHTTVDSNTPNLVHVEGSAPMDAVVDEAFTSIVAPQEMANTILDSTTFSRLRAEVLLGHTSAVLMANDGSVEGKDITQGFITRLISVLNNDLKAENEKGGNSSSNYYEIRMLAFAFQTATEGKDLSQGNAVKHVNQEVKLGTNPVFGTTFLRVEDVLINPAEGENTPEVKKVLRELNSVINFVSADLPVIALQFVIKRIVESTKEEPEGTVFLSTVLVLISNNSQANSMYFDAFTNPAITPPQLIKAAIGGGCVTAALLSLSSARQHSERVSSALTSLQNISVLGNTPPRSGNVNRFLSYVKNEHEKLKNNEDTDPVILKKVEGMLTETKKFMRNPKANKPALHVLSSQKSSRNNHNQTKEMETNSKADNGSSQYDNSSAKSVDKKSSSEENKSKSSEKAKIAVRESGKKSSNTTKTSRTNSVH